MDIRSVARYCRWVALERSQAVAHEADHGPRVSRNTRTAGSSASPLASLQRTIGNQAVSRLVQRSLGDDLVQAGSQLLAGGGALSSGGAAAGAGLIGQAGSALVNAGAGAKASEGAGGSSSAGGGLPLPRAGGKGFATNTMAMDATSEASKDQMRWDSLPFAGE